MKIKKNYKIIVQKTYFCRYSGETREQYSESDLGKYRHKYSNARNIHTFNERKQNHYAKKDGILVRGARKHLPTNWDDPRIARVYGRSWKDYTKRKKQWDKYCI
jgi:hypothetical protein